MPALDLTNPATVTDDELLAWAENPGVLVMLSPLERELLVRLSAAYTVMDTLDAHHSKTVAELVRHVPDWPDRQLAGVLAV